MKKLVTYLFAAAIAMGANAQVKKAKTAPAKTTQSQDKIKPNVEYTTASGLKYKITHQGNGTQASSGSKVSVHYTGTLLNGTKFDSSRDRGEPFSFKLGAGQVIRGWDEGIALLKVGDRAILTIPAELGYGAQENGNIPANSVLVFDVELMDVQEGVKPYDVKGKDTLNTASGLEYIVVSKGAKGGARAANGKNVSVHYTGYLTDGTIFDSSVERGNPIKFKLGEGKVIPGWEEGIALMSVGDKMRLVIPSKLAYGERGAGGVIPPNATIIFDVELMDVTEPVTPKPFDVAGKDTITTASGLQYIVVRKSSDANAVKADAGRTVSVDYTGYLTDGRIFDSSISRGEPIAFPLGGGRVIKGWDEGIALMHVGDQFRLIIPSNLAYGEREMGMIPANATLIFDVELKAVR